MQQLLDAKEVATALKVSYRTVLDQINLGKLEAYQVGNQYRISESSYLKYLESIKVKRVAF
ncbi:MAG: helix-turn-helix domain-containing protein [Candidatus Marinimicrobia bacterium]|jgi:excisionase family DNA binding protein|nr:helix-turn-helix domain-containing protein [Candidatus Neomarinimicrobiota bacterium]MBT4944899.1 helix-turn-helix domain-containing protein [Candidatus Neomarinimicrobiota bacterium]